MADFLQPKHVQNCCARH